MLCFYDVLFIYLFITENVRDPGKTSYILFYYYYVLNKLSMIMWRAIWRFWKACRNSDLIKRELILGSVIAW